jgi:hypothetical protein
MGFKLGEAPKGWFPISDIRYIDLGIALVFVHFIAIIMGSLISPDPWGFITRPGVVACLGVVFLALIIASALRNSVCGESYQTTFGRNYRVDDAEKVVREISKRLPRKFYPLKKTFEKEGLADLYEGEEVRYVKLTLREADGVKQNLEIVGKVERHLVEVRVMTSNGDSYATHDLLKGLSDYFGKHRMDWLSVDVDEDATLLMAMSKRDKENGIWDERLSFLALARSMKFILAFMLIVWLVIGWAIIDPVSGIVMDLAILGILINPLLIACVVAIEQSMNHYRNSRTMFEYTKAFHASPWYVTAGIQEGLLKEGRTFKSGNRIDHDLSETFALLDVKEGPVTIDVTWDDYNTDPNWTSVRIRTSGEVEDLQTIKDLVRMSVFNRHHNLGL